jgi:sigma-B regulation protein RsbU (phosphoserine phosphatase)
MTDRAHPPYTDGITEAMNPKREQYGLERLAKSLCEAAKRPAPEIVDHILQDVHRFMVSQEDDISLVVVRQTA